MNEEIKNKIIEDLKNRIIQENINFKKLMTIPHKDDNWNDKLLKVKYRNELLKELLEYYENL